MKANAKQTNMHPTDAYPQLHLAAMRLLDAIEARPRDRAEFDAAKEKSLRNARVALADEPVQRPHCGWLRAASRLGRALGAHRKDRAFRRAADFLELPRLCARSTCHKAQSCRGDARVCLKEFGPRVPESVRTAIVAFCERIERGDTPELAVTLLPLEGKTALWAWWKATFQPMLKRTLLVDRFDPRRNAGKKPARIAAATSGGSKVERV